MTMLTPEEMQKARSPKELMEYFWSTYDGVTPEERQLARLKKGLWKNFFHELSVLNIFANWKFPNNDVMVEYIIGNQGYDAKISNASYVEHVEITFPSLGEREKQEANEINLKGYSFVKHDHDELIRRFLSTADRKSQKDYIYPASSLLFALDMFLLPDTDINRIANTFAETLRKFQFKVKSVYLVLINTNQPDINKKVLVVSQS